MWPIPASFANGSSTLAVSPSLKFTVSGVRNGAATPSTLTKAFARYASIMFPHASGGGGQEAAASTLASVTVNVDAAGLNDNYPQIETDESYTLAVPADGSGATLTAKTVYGALHGLETLSQLVAFDFDTETYKIAGAPWKVTSFMEGDVHQRLR